MNEMIKSSHVVHRYYKSYCTYDTIILLCDMIYNITKVISFL